ncbi:zinc finger protein ZAT5-like [Curcuma longa]|uniref:zinc finger protein ZAT5-like n=1 Tax=Curcuma longa TaxID=136217 RepID=UPI003D9F5A54
MELAADEGNSSASGSVSDVEFFHTTVINKRKRTKRHRTHHPPPPLPLVADSSSASSAETISGTITEEEEDMANCLILLAQGRAFSEPEKRRDEKFARRRLAGAGKVAGEFLYECKTCNKCFPSFQALGGHRTSHKKPKLEAVLALEPRSAEENKRKLPIVSGDDNLLQISLNSSFSAKPKLHECAICGSEFSSGQALGGHMRRHRPLAVADAHAHASAKKEKSSFLSFDLNLPAAADVGEAQSPPSPSTFSSAGNRSLSSPDLPQLWWRTAITKKKEDALH